VRARYHPALLKLAKTNSLAPVHMQRAGSTTGFGATGFRKVRLSCFSSIFLARQPPQTTSACMQSVPTPTAPHKSSFRQQLIGAIPIRRRRIRLELLDPVGIKVEQHAKAAELLFLTHGMYELHCSDPIPATKAL
jgi:hypothetical protein